MTSSLVLLHPDVVASARALDRGMLVQGARSLRRDSILHVDITDELSLKLTEVPDVLVMETSDGRKVIVPIIHANTKWDWKNAPPGLVILYTAHHAKSSDEPVGQIACPKCGARVVWKKRGPSLDLARTCPCYGRRRIRKPH